MIRQPAAWILALACAAGVVADEGVPRARVLWEEPAGG